MESQSLIEMFTEWLDTLEDNLSETLPDQAPDEFAVALSVFLAQNQSLTA
jgi:hypothetical protein